MRAPVALVVLLLTLFALGPAARAPGDGFEEARATARIALVHGLLGEARVGEKWVMAETAASKARRTAIQAAIQAAKSGAPKPGALSADQAEAGLVPEWKCGAQTPDVRVLGTCDAAECERIAQ